MLVLRITVIVLEVGLAADLQLAQHAGVDQFGQRAIDRGPAHIEARVFEILDELIGVEMAMPGEDVLDQVLLLLGKSLRRRTAGQILAELIHGRLRHLHGRKRHEITPRSVEGSVNYRVTQNTEPSLIFSSAFSLCSL